ncbi:hypothetical protein [Streptosporangium oxazolinicum]|uniref:hypothetical protein n=1 Tax=Streptosporangium oxazolinicum TaxID=909287 RepID=UPI0031F0371C
MNQTLRSWETVNAARSETRPRDIIGKLGDPGPLARDGSDERRIHKGFSGDVKGTPSGQMLREDVEGHDDLKPNPLAATTKEQFLQCMRDFQVWAKEPSFREIARNSGGAVAFSTLSTALDPTKLRF